LRYALDGLDDGRLEVIDVRVERERELRRGGCGRRCRVGVRPGGGTIGRADARRQATALVAKHQIAESRRA
jgi:hypothetical protein